MQARRPATFSYPPRLRRCDGIASQTPNWTRPDFAEHGAEVPIEPADASLVNPRSSVVLVAR
jgi:hypothetical protein